MIPMFCEPNTWLMTFSSPGHRKRLASSIDQLIPYILQNPNTAGIATRLEFSRGQTLAGEESSHLKDAAVAEMHSYMDNMIGLDNWQIPDMPLVNSRAGLYVYLSAAVCLSAGYDDMELMGRQDADII